MTFSIMITLFALALLMGTIRQVNTTGGDLYRPAFNSPPETIALRITPSDFSGSDFVDDEGYLIPGLGIAADGTIAGDAVDETAEYVVPYAVQVAESNAAADLTAAPDGDIAVATRGDVVLEYVEDNVGRVLTANEKAAINSTGRFVIV